MVRTRATCGHCGREFLFFQLYNADPRSGDRCPNCNRHLGIVNVRPLALRTDRIATELVRCLNDLADHDPSFDIDADSLLGPIDAALRRLVRDPQADPRLKGRATVG